MKTDILLFTQTMHALLSSFLSLQSALAICTEILSGKSEKKFTTQIIKKVNEGKKLSTVLSEHKLFTSFYVSLVAIGEESGTLAHVFGHLASYLKAKKNMRTKIAQALLYPALVLITAIVVVFVLTIFVMPRLESIFEAFAESSANIPMQMANIKLHFFISGIIMSALIALIVACTIAHSFNQKAAFALDTMLLKLPLVKDFILTMQLYDFSFAMKLLTSTHFPFVQSLTYSKAVLINRRIKKAIETVCKNITDGHGIGKSFEKEKLFPKYLTVWIKIAEENGEAAKAFSQLCEYYQSENETIVTGITQSAEPVFIAITGAIIIGIIAQFIMPIFNLLGAL